MGAFLLKKATISLRRSFLRKTTLWRSPHEAGKKCFDVSMPIRLICSTDGPLRLKYLQRPHSGTIDAVGGSTPTPDVANDFCQRLDPVDFMTADARLHPISPGTFDQRAPDMLVAGLGDAPASGGLTARSLTWTMPK